MAVLPDSKAHDFRSLVVNGQCYASAEYDHEGKHIHVFTTHAEYNQLPDAARALFPMIAEVPRDHDIVIDFYFSILAGWAIRRLRSRKSARCSTRPASRAPSGASWRQWPAPGIARERAACAFHLSSRRKYV